jgi:hypothetical protein
MRFRKKKNLNLESCGRKYISKVFEYFQPYDNFGDIQKSFGARGRNEMKSPAVGFLQNLLKGYSTNEVPYN